MISNPEVILLEPSPIEVIIPAAIVKTTPIHVSRSSASLKINTPKIAVATSSIFNQIETDAALAVFRPTNKRSEPAKPLKKMISMVLAQLPD